MNKEEIIIKDWGDYKVIGEFLKSKQIIDEVFKNYEKNAVVGNVIDSHYEPKTDKWNIYNKEEFINVIKKDDRFSEKWGLKIEERELSLSKRGELFRKIYPEKSLNDFSSGKMEVQSIRCQLNSRYNNSNIPTKLITITYKETIIESYE